MADERINIYDENNMRIGDMMKSEAYKQWQYVRAVILYVFNTENKLRLQKRPKDKWIKPDCRDATVSGHIALWEEPTVAMIREAEEEAGIMDAGDKIDFIQVYTCHGQNEYRWHNYLYVLQWYDGPFEFKDGEVEDMQTFTLEQVEDIFAWNNMEFPWFPRAQEFTLIKNYLQETRF